MKRAGRILLGVIAVLILTVSLFMSFQYGMMTWIGWQLFWFYKEVWLWALVALSLVVLPLSILRSGYVKKRLKDLIKKSARGVVYLGILVVLVIFWAAVLPFPVMAVQTAWDDKTREPRTIVILIDNSSSMIDTTTGLSPETFKDACKVADKLLTWVRPVDHVFAYRIAANFNDSQCKLTCSPGKINVTPPSLAERGSNYFYSLRLIRDVLTRPQAGEKLLFVIGDMAHQDQGGDVVIQLPQEESSEDNSLKEVSAFFIYPSTSLRSNQKNLKGMWQKYLIIHGCTRFMLPFPSITEALDWNSSIMSH